MALNKGENAIIASHPIPTYKVADSQDGQSIHKNLNIIPSMAKVQIVKKIPHLQ
ncbi:hypothetical protein SDC9_117946 [bioreactor metagenome]|uniref:Uncharacterized protein n=1 Tax=bioreactor metagenome TaxID=1076179 RepID=A0A645C6N8_9ZZZZ